MKTLFSPLLMLLVSMGFGYADSLDFYSLPPSGNADAMSLNGPWKFKYVTGQDAGPDEAFVKPVHDVSNWREIKVPGHWELQGFATPRYAGDLADGLGLYRRTFKVDAPKPGERRYLRFEGALFGYVVWLNGKKLGEWNSGFNPATFDVTDVLIPGDNVLAVRISTRSRGWDFDTMDCWSISGIYREVTLYTLPATHLLDQVVRTELRPDGSAHVDLTVRASAKAELSATLVDPEGKAAGSCNLSLGSDGQGRGSMVVANPRLWNAETPSLYRLKMELRVDGKVSQQLEQKVGLRQVTIQAGVLMLNGRPIKLRGVDHHEMWPEEGRVATEERLRKDLTLMRQANINFIRTSHYPPHPKLLDLADEMGFYVDCEVPFIHGREHLKDPAFQEDLYRRAKATVSRDKNHASIIFWSLGNENPVNPLGLNAGKFVKEIDPTRPITFPTMGSHFRTNWEKFPAYVDLYSPHYPSGSTISEYAGKLERPIVATEYAHMRGISRGGKGLQDAWDAMYANPRAAGGAVWKFQDQGLLREAKDPATVTNGDLMVWLDEHRYYDTNGYFGVDGIVYSDRTPQVDYWWLRKVYSPIQIEAAPSLVAEANGGFKVVTENRHDFRSLAGYVLRWTLRRNQTALDSGDLRLTVQAKAKETLLVPAKVPAQAGDDVYALELRCLNPEGQSVYERSLRIDTGCDQSHRSSVVQKSLPETTSVLTVDEAAIVVRNDRWRLRVDRQTGEVALTDAQGAMLFSAAGPHTGRKLLITELGKRREGEAKYWGGELLKAPKDLRTSAEKTKDGYLLKVAGTYARPGHPDQGIEGEYEFAIRPSGAIKVAYRYLPVNAQDNLVETGFTLATPATLTEFRWLGMGPYANYPGKDRHAEYGLHHLGRDDLYFPGQRRGTELALLTSASGEGLLLAADGQTVSVEHRGALNLLTHVSEGGKNSKSKAKDEDKVSAKDEGVDNKSDFKASSLKSISGRFVLIPLGKEWPAPLRSWFGASGRQAETLHPFLRSYDQ